MDALGSFAGCLQDRGACCAGAIQRAMLTCGLPGTGAMKRKGTQTEAVLFLGDSKT
jgi:hypothetical protein